MSVAFISGNTATTLSIVFIAGGNNQIPISFNLGDHYAIRRVEAAQDQPGMGVIEMSSADADQNTGLAVRVADKNRVLSAGNPVGWQNQQRDPCFNWNCWTGGGAIFGSGKELKMWTSLGSIKEGRDFFNSQKPAPGYGSLAGGLVVEAMSPGYPVIAAPTAAEQQCERPGFQAWTIA